MFVGLDIRLKYRDDMQVKNNTACRVHLGHIMHHFKHVIERDIAHIIILAFLHSLHVNYTRA